ncbi:hypothetical protein Q8A73_009554 [Channa argus]|nr:hypothetical protein Q8A73_009554 [Channa argus]
MSDGGVSQKGAEEGRREGRVTGEREARCGACDSATLAELRRSLTAVVSPELWESTFSPEGAKGPSRRKHNFQPDGSGDKEPAVNCHVGPLGSIRAYQRRRFRLERVIEARLAARCEMQSQPCPVLLGKMQLSRSTTLLPPRHFWTALGERSEVEVRRTRGSRGWQMYRRSFQRVYKPHTPGPFPPLLIYGHSFPYLGLTVNSNKWHYARRVRVRVRVRATKRL